MPKSHLLFPLLVLVGGCGDPTTIVVEPLRVVNWSPAGGETCVDIATGVYITFSDDVTPESLTADSLHVLAASGPVTAALAYDPATLTASLTPVAALDYGRLYTIEASEAITSKAKGALAVRLQSSFQTEAQTGCGEAQCLVPADCGAGKLCSSIGTCIDECVTSRDCPTGKTCSTGACS